MSARARYAGRVAEAVSLDVAAAGWSPTIDNYLGRVTKARILQAAPGGSITAASPTPDVELGSPIKSGEDSATTGYETAMANSGFSPENQPVATEPPAVATE